MMWLLLNILVELKKYMINKLIVHELNNVTFGNSKYRIYYNDKALVTINPYDTENFELFKNRMEICCN